MFPPQVSAARPQDFFIPGLDLGLKLLRSEVLAPEMVRPVNVEVRALASDTEQRQKAHSQALMLRNNTWKKGVVFPTVLAIAENVSFRKHLSVNGKYFLSSAGGSRLRNRYAERGPKEEGVSSDQALVDYIREQSFKNVKPIPVHDGDFRGLDLVIETRNFFNFYHFLKESFPVLALYDRYGLTGRVKMVTSSRAEAMGFVVKLIETWFPHLADKVDLVRGEHKFGTALIPLDTRFYYYQCRERVIPSLEEVGPGITRRAASRQMNLSAMNSYEGPVADLRAHVLTRLGVEPVGKRRLYIKRRSSRNRRVVGEELLLDQLELMGFEIVYFEDHSVEEQARLVAQAECIVSLHGAGLANMLFAPEGCHVIELSNLQTLIKRYGDFNPLALAAGVHYVHFILDHDYPDKSVLPQISQEGHRGVELSPFTAEVVAASIRGYLDPEAKAQVLSAGQELNGAGAYEALEELLDRNWHLVADEADASVWRANCLAERRDAGGCLTYLSAAMVLAPRRIPLIKRTLALAHKLGNAEVFRQASVSLHRADPAGAEAYMAENGWTGELTESRV